MRSFEQQHKTIRQFLLGKLSEELAVQIEDRIFTEPEFAEEAQMVEHELIADHHAGRLTREESEQFAAKYASQANRFEVDSEKALHEFVALKAARVVPAEPRVDSPAAADSSFMQRVQTFAFSLRRSLVYGALAVTIPGALLAWIVLPRLWTPPSVSEERARIEAELTALNSSGASPSDIFSRTDLQIAHRASGVIARVAPLNATLGKVLEFNLVLADASAKPYRVLVFDDKRNELFAISNPTPQNSKDGPRLRIFIPLKYLKPGDYQLDLAVANEAGGYDEVNSYTFRITR